MQIEATVKRIYACTTGSKTRTYNFELGVEHLSAAQRAELHGTWRVSVFGNPDASQPLRVDQRSVSGFKCPVSQKLLPGTRVLLDR